MDNYFEGERPPDAHDHRITTVPWEERMQNWMVDLECDPLPDASTDLPSDPDTDIDEVDESYLPGLVLYRDLISTSSTYEWLLARLHREVALSRQQPDLMEVIREAITSKLQSPGKISRYRSSEALRFTFEVEWDPVAFVKEQRYEEEPGDAIGRAITITGSAVDAQATTCAEYLRQTWPVVGKHTLQLVKNVVRGRPGYRHTCEYKILKSSHTAL
jgi:hypothetical protein